jgi:AraC-like DNA-binding protein
LRAKDLIDARYRERLDVSTLARAAHLSSAHFSREFRRAFGETPHQYLLTRRLERAAALLRNTDRTVAYVCAAVGLRSGPAPLVSSVETVPPRSKEDSRC